MIDHVDTILRQVLLDEVPALRPSASTLATQDQVRFQAPDDAWRGELPNIVVNNTPVNALNVYLLDVREARKLRSNERIVEERDGVAVREPAPFRVDCHYLITAWSPIQTTPTLEPTFDEHRVLAQVLVALARRSPLAPTRVLSSAQLAQLPLRLQQEQLPTHVAPADGFPKLGELWAAMGAGARWKPGAYVVVTVPLTTEATVLGLPVTAVIADTGIEDAAPERLVVIGGTALDVRGGRSLALPGASVVLDAATGTVARTVADGDGRFVFAALVPGPYTLRGHTPGFAQAETRLVVPSSSGTHDLLFRT